MLLKFGDFKVAVTLIVQTPMSVSDYESILMLFAFGKATGVNNVSQVIAYVIPVRVAVYE